MGVEQPQVCAWPWTSLEINANQSFNCCWARQIRFNHMAPKGPWSHVKGEPLVNIVNSPEARLFRTLMAQSGCAVCGPDRRCAAVWSLSPCPAVADEIQRANHRTLETDLLTGMGQMLARPLHVGLNIGYRCNLWCPMCPTDRSQPAGPWIPHEVAESLLALKDTALTWHITGGEPLTAPQDLLDMVIPQSTPSLVVTVDTNLFVSPSRAEWVANRASRLQVSLHSLECETARQIQPGVDLAHVSANVRRAAALTTVEAITVLRACNIDEMPALPAALKALGVHRWTATIMVDYGRIAPEENLLTSGPQRAEEVRRLARVLYRAQQACQEVNLPYQWLIPPDVRETLNAQ